MRMRTWTICLFASILVLGNGCYYDNEEELYPNSFCDTVNVNYSGAVSEIIASRCATPGCHVAGGDGAGDFTIFSEITEKVNNGRFLRSIRRESNGAPMPPGGPLPACELRQLELWIEAGAQQN